MYRSLISGLAATLMAVSAVTPVRADSGATTSSSQNAQADWGSVPKKTVSLCLATAVGAPVCFVRRTIHADKDGAHGLVGETEKKYLLIPAGVIWFPLALAVGLMETPGATLKNSFYNFDKPFSKDQFSLGEMNGD